MRSLLIAFALVVAAGCGDSKATAPSGGSSGVPNSTSSSSSSSSGGDPVESKPDAGKKDSGGTTVPLGPGNVRLMAANLSSGNKQSYDPGEGTRIFQGLHPDVVMIQEFNFGDGSDTAVRSFIDTAFGPSFTYYRESGAGLTIPNGVISRYPILESGRWAAASADRGFVYAKIQVPGSHPLWAVSVHLLTTSADKRSAEADALVPLIQGKVGADDLLAIGGDFNSDTRSEACLITFQTIVDVTNSKAVDNLGNAGTNAPRVKPYDWVLGSPNLVAQQVPTTIGANSFANGLVFDSRVYTPIDDVAPVKTEDSGAVAMQHMAIIKDFHLE